MDTLNDAEEAFKYMLPNATKQVNYLGEESAFFTSQAYKETRRCTMINYTMSREHFVDMGEQMHKHMHSLTQGWGQFLDFYSDLNNARKESDDKYAELSYIGEEIVEPDEEPVRNNDLIDNYGQKRNNIYDEFMSDGFGQPIQALNREPRNAEEESKQESVGSGMLLTDLQNEIKNEEEQS